MFAKYFSPRYYGRTYFPQGAGVEVFFERPFRPIGVTASRRALTGVGARSAGVSGVASGAGTVTQATRSKGGA